MESSGEQALVIGVNILILIVALTCAIMLMTTVLDMSNAANTVIKTTTDSSLMTLYGGTNERIYTGEQVLALVGEYLATTNNMTDKYILKINSVSVTKEYIANGSFTKNVLDSKYYLKYIGKDANSQKDMYNFERI